MPPKKGRGNRDSDNETESDSQEYQGTFETLRDEGEHFVHVANYKKAIDSFSKVKGWMYMLVDSSATFKCSYKLMSQFVSGPIVIIFSMYMHKHMPVLHVV